ncbi:MAG TPA: serine protease [Pyrinomonadaceae bacterium]|nr:serine protease [Pyrinomonadaceae bacterium]
MKRNSIAAAVLSVAILAFAPTCFGDGAPAARAKPDDQTVSLDLKFTKKKPNAVQRLLSILDYGPNGFATGFVVGDGLVMTAYHAVSGKLSDSKKAQLGFSASDELQVAIFVNGCSARVIKIDEEADLALLRICQSKKNAKTPAFQGSLIKDEQLVVIARQHGSKVIKKGVFFGPQMVGTQEFSLAKIDGRDGYSGSPVYNDKAEIVGVFSGYDRMQKLAVISPGMRAQKLLEDYAADGKQ